MLETRTKPTENLAARNWIDGQWVTGGDVLESINPSTGEVVGTYHSAGADEAEAAIAAARRTFDTTSWSRSPGDRAAALNEMADNLAVRVDEIASTLTLENGKLRAQTGGESAVGVSWLRYNAALALTEVAGRAAEPNPGKYFSSQPEPAGVAGVIAPWNGLIALTVRAIAPALAAGCCVVIKLPGQTGVTNGLIAEVVAQTKSLPAGALNILTEAGNEVAPRLVSSNDVDVVSYTGSTKVGRAIAASAAPRVKRLNLELGGKTPLIVFDDADVDAILPQLVNAGISLNGQFCITGSRVLVQRGIADEVREKLSAALAAVKIGRADDPASRIGPLIDHASVERVEKLVEEAQSYGKILVRGGRPDDPALQDGSFYGPTLIEVEELDVPLVQQEIFGPVQTFELFEDEAEAVQRANATDFGLAASVFTTDDIRARRVGRELRVGAVWFNTWALHSEHFEQPGLKQSGYGKLVGPTAIEEFQNLKVYATTGPSYAH